MNKKYIYRLFFLTIGILCISSAYSQTDYGDFPYYQSFRSTMQPSEIQKAATPNGASSNAVTFTSTGMQLTPANTNQFGGVFINNRKFRTIQGIKLEFEYVIYNGGGADGLSVFLFDANTANPNIGASGASIGYAYNRTNNQFTSSRAPGLSSAYLGIALDSYGNFKQRRWQGESRRNGIPDLTTSTADRYVSNVTLRGARGNSYPVGNINGMSDGYTGYPVLISQPTRTNQQGWRLNDTGGGYSAISSYSGNFTLRGGSLFTSDNDASYRKAMIELYPAGTQPNIDGFYVTVKIQHGKTVTTVINDYLYKTTITYAENAYTTAGDNNTNNPTTPSSTNVSLTTSIPGFFRIGFAASTGAVTDIHLLRELKITLPSSAEAYDDYATTQRALPVTIDALNNDIGYTGVVSKNQVGNSSYLDPYTFRFCDANGNFIGNVEATRTYYSTSAGMWIFDFATAKLTFSPTTDFVGNTTVQYSIKAGKNNEEPYVDEAYRSLPATVTVGVIYRDLPKTVISNRMVTPVIVPPAQ